MEKHIVIEELRHSAPLEYRYKLEDTLAALDPHTEATVSGLADALNDEDSDVRLLAIQILGELGTNAEAALPAMVRALDDEDRLVRIAALEPVASFGGKAIDAIPILESWLEQTEDEFSRVVAAGHIPRIDSQRVAEMTVHLEEATSRDTESSLHAHCLLNELMSPTKDDGIIPEHRNPKLTIKQLVMLLREPRPDHAFFEPDLSPHDQQELRESFSPDAIQHVALGQLVDYRAKEAVPDILKLIESPETREDLRLHAARAVFDITGEPVNFS